MDNTKIHMENSVENEIRNKRDQSPFWYCIFITKRPWLAFGLTLGGHVVLTLLNFILLACGYDIFPADFHSFPVDLKGYEVAQREDAWIQRNIDNPLHLSRIVVDDLGPTWDRGYSVDEVKIFVTKWNENLFERDTLSVLKDIEDNLFNISSYQSQFCKLDGVQQCIKPTSVLRYFDGTFRHVSEVFYDPDFSNINEVIHEAYTNSATAEEFRYFLGKGYSIAPDYVFVDLTRVSFPLGWPLDRNNTEKENHELVSNFLQDEVKPLLADSAAKYQEDIEFSYISVKLFEDDVMIQAMYDLLLAVGSLAFIFCFIWFITRSLWVTGWAVMSIITSFWITNLVYRIVLDYVYIGYFHLIAIFIILGIGADDIFVFYNNWKATAFHQYKTMAHQLSDAFRRSAGTMFFTSATTMSAFLSGGLSPILPLGSFGIFTGILVAVNYVSVIVFFPTVIFTHHMMFNKYAKNEQKLSKTNKAYCSGHSVEKDGGSAYKAREYREGLSKTIQNQRQPSHEDANQSTLKTSSNSYIGEKSIKRAEVKEAVDNDDLDKIINREKKKSDASKDITGKKKNILTRFLIGPFFNIVTHKHCRFVILILFFALIGMLGWSATTIEIDSEEIKIYRANTNYGRAMRYAGSGFIPTGDTFVVLFLVWGLRPRDFSMCHKTGYKCPGEQQWDNYFDLNTPPSQMALVKFCHKIKHELSAEEIERLMIRNDTTSGKLAVDCFMDNLSTYLLDDGEHSNLTLDYPLEQNNMEAYMSAQPTVYEPPENLPSSFYRYFEIGLSNWMNNHYTMMSSPDFISYNALLGESRDDPNTFPVLFHDQIFNTTLGYYGTKLKYAAIRVNLSLSTQELGFQQGLPVMDVWEEFFNDELQQMPVQLQSGFQVTEVTWHWLTIQKTLVENAALGIVLGITIAFLILVLATMNVLTGFFATLNIFFITTCVIGVIPLAGWKLDVMISMNLCLLVGLSVDYVVHLAEGYHLSLYPSRKLKVKDTLDHLGVSVLCGAGTTLGAAFFMLFAKIQFFLQFGTFLFCTIGFSLLFSLCFFTTFMALCGPEANRGSLRPAIAWLRFNLTGKSGHIESMATQTCDTDETIQLRDLLEENGGPVQQRDLQEAFEEDENREIETAYL